jgi:hypothetical protein
MARNMFAIASQTTRRQLHSEGAEMSAVIRSNLDFISQKIVAADTGRALTNALLTFSPRSWTAPSLDNFGFVA